MKNAFLVLAVLVAGCEPATAPSTTPKTDQLPVFKVDPVPTTYTFMEVAVSEHGKPANEKFFLGRLPIEGESVEMVYVGEHEGRLRFQLRVRESK